MCDLLFVKLIVSVGIKTLDEGDIETLLCNCKDQLLKQIEHVYAQIISCKYYGWINS